MSDVADLDELHDDYLYFVRANEAEDLRQILPTPHLDLNHRNAQGNAALHMAAANGLADLIDVLCSYVPESPRAGVQVDVRNELGNTPLAWAAQQNQLGAVRRLVHFGADVNSINATKLTPLDLALLAGAHEDVCNALVSAGGKTFESLQEFIATSSNSSATAAATSVTAADDDVVNAPDAVEFDDDDDNNTDNTTNNDAKADDSKSENLQQQR
jgi:ankyrin repeat protein